MPATNTSPIAAAGVGIARKLAMGYHSGGMVAVTVLELIFSRESDTN